MTTPTTPPKPTITDRIEQHFNNNKWAWLICILNIIIGSLIASYTHYHWIGGDLRTNWDSAQYMQAGYNNRIYTQSQILESLPGILILLQPITVLVNHISLFQTHITKLPNRNVIQGAYLPILVPYILAWNIIPLTATAAWAKHWHIPTSRLIYTLILTAFILDWCIVWGHPEDLFAFGCMLFATLDITQHKPKNAGWWMALGLCMQLYIGLAIPILLIMAGKTDWYKFLLRAATLPTFLFAYFLAINPAPFWYTMTTQPVPVFKWSTPTNTISTHGILYVYTHLPLKMQKYYQHHYRSASIPRLLEEITAVIAAAIYYKTKPRWNEQNILWLLSTLLMIRAIEPLIFVYYLTPALACITITSMQIPLKKLIYINLLSLIIIGYLNIPEHSSIIRWLILLLLLTTLSTTTHHYINNTLTTHHNKPRHQRYFSKLFSVPIYLVAGKPALTTNNEEQNPNV